MRLIHCFALITTAQIGPLWAQDLKSIFHIPSRRNYDNLEILERSNFNDDSAPSSSPAPPSVDTPRAYANAQVLLRFGAEPDKTKCGCGDVCQCRSQPNYVPVMTPLPYCCCVPPYYYSPPTTAVPSGGGYPQNLLPCQHPSPLPPPTTAEASSAEPPPAPVVEIVAPKPETLKKQPEDCGTTNQAPFGQSDNIVDEQTENSEINNNNNNHPEILQTVTLSEDSIKSEKAQDIGNVKCLEEVSNKLEPSELSSNVKFVSLDLEKLPKTCKACAKKVSKHPKKEIDECLIPYTSPKLPEPKLLLTYPIFNRPSEPRPEPSRVILKPLAPTIAPVVQCTQSGYSVSGGSGFYADPSNTVIYRRPTLVQIVAPQTRMIRREERPRYVLVPVAHDGPRVHDEDGCCCCCAKYVGEMNEQEQAV